MGDIFVEQRATSELSTFDEPHPVRPVLRDDILCDPDSSSSSFASFNKVQGIQGFLQSTQTTEKNNQLLATDL